MNVYEGADRALKEINRQNLKAFGRLKLARWDELSVIREVTETFNRSVELVKRKFFEAAIEAFIIALYEMGREPEEATRKADEKVTNQWVLDVLKEPDPTVMYAFIQEAERKKQRLIEALAAAPNKPKVIDDALKYWARQIGFAAVMIVDAARIAAFKAADVEHVKWNTLMDGRECHECRERNGRVYRIDRIPPKPHPGCRCWYTAA